MAETVLAYSKLHLLFDAGMDKDGKQAYKVKTFSNIRKDATAEQLIQTADAIGALSNDTLSRTERTDNSQLI